MRDLTEAIKMSIADVERIIAINSKMGDDDIKPILDDLHVNLLTANTALIIRNLFEKRLNNFDFRDEPELVNAIWNSTSQNQVRNKL